MGADGGDQDSVTSDAQSSDARQERICVSVRIRPLNEKEIQSNDFADWECIDKNTILFKNCLAERSMYPNAYTFDRVFGFDSATRQVYEEAAKEVALSVLNGINSSLFAYGQTSSGKTFTMGGITQYAVADIYGYIDQHKEREYVLKFSAMEIYNEHVRDLLSAETTPLRLLDDPERGTVVDKLIEEPVKDKSHLLELIAVCEAQRQTGETSLNETSSRSHQILRLTIESSARQFGGGNSSLLAASVNFVDLAGSERTSQTLATGTRLKEGSHINRSLLTLGKVIRKLSKGRNGHVPYRDSKLTRILQNSLGGNARTAIVCTMSPAHSHLEQTRNTLLFASCAKQVSTNAQVNVVMSDKALVKHLRKELARLERELKNMSLVSSKGDVTSVLKDKELQIEKMDREIKELSRQRDIAQSRVEDLLRSSWKNQFLLQEDDDSHHHSSASRERMSWLDDSEVTSDTSDYQRLDVDLTTSDSFQYLHENGIFDLNAQQPELLENTLLSEETSPQLLHTTADFDPPSDDPIPVWEKMNTTRRTTDVGTEDEDDCKEVHCIEVEELSINRKTKLPESVKISPHEENKKEEDQEEEKKESFNIAKNEYAAVSSEEKKEERESLHSDAEYEKTDGKESHHSDTECERRDEKESHHSDGAGYEKRDEKDSHHSHAQSEKRNEKEPVRSDAEYDALVKKIKELQRTINSLVNCNLMEQPSPRCTEPERLSSGGSNLTRSRSCKAVLVTSPTSTAFERTVVHHRDQSLGGFEKWLISGSKPKGFHRASDPKGATDGKLSRLGIQTSIRAAIMNEMEEDAKYSEASETSSQYSSVEGKYDDAKPESDTERGNETDGATVEEAAESKDSRSNYKEDSATVEEAAESKDSRSNFKEDGATVEEAAESKDSGSNCKDGATVKEEAESKHSRSNSCVKDDASFVMPVRDCMSEGMLSCAQSPLNWQEEFQNQRRQLIELWHACHIPLVHRTYFFLLFKGDPSDKVYMEVELRRLSFMKNRFSQGQKIVMDDQVFTTSSSLRALNQEREMLMRQIYKRIPAQERESLFKKWGISINSKQRRLQLTRRLWNDTKDMQHIRDSASLVAKLVGFEDEGQVPKEMFVGPSFTLKTLNRRSYSWKSNMSSIA